jgi:hypothetical protein
MARLAQSYLLRSRLNSYVFVVLAGLVVTAAYPVMFHFNQLAILNLREELVMTFTKIRPIMLNGPIFCEPRQEAKMTTRGWLLIIAVGVLSIAYVSRVAEVSPM